MLDFAVTPLEGLPSRVTVWEVGPRDALGRPRSDVFEASLYATSTSKIMFCTLTDSADRI